MIKPQNSPQVKRNPGLPIAKKRRRSIPDGAAMKLPDLKKLSKRAQAGKKSPGYLLKRDFLDFLSLHPKVSAAYWKVAYVIVGHFNFKYGRSWPSIQYIQEAAGVKSRRTVDNAVRFFHEEGLIFSQSGGYGSVRANEYAPNFRLILNCDTGEIVRNAPYLTADDNRTVSQSVSGANPRGCQVPERKKCVPKSGAQKMRTEKSDNRQKYADPVRKKCAPCSDSVMGGAPTSPASADAAAGSAPRPKDDVDPRKIGRILSASLAEHLGLTWEQLIDLITGRGEPGGVERLDGLCKSELFNMGKPTAGLLADKFPSGVGVFGHVVIHGLDGRVEYNEKGANHVQIGRLSPDQWLLLDYRPAPAYLIEVEKQLRESAIGPQGPKNPGASG